MKRVLQIVDSMGMGGIQAFIMNVYREINREEIQFDFLLHSEHEQSYDNEIVNMGGRIYYLPARKEGISKNRKALRNFFAEHKEYSVVHMHISSLTYIEPLVIAKEMGIPIRIVHAHSTRASGHAIHTFLHWINKWRIADVATHYYACGNMAADWFFKGTSVANKYVIINNGIKIHQYQFDMNKRQQVREQMGLTNRWVFGHVGRFSKVKNHQYLVNVFSKVCEKYSDKSPILLLVGDGELRPTIEAQVQELGLTEQVIFLGTRHDVPLLLQTIDILLMPSIYEGFPVTIVEGQATGVPCYISDSITKDVVLKENVHMLDISVAPSEWANAIQYDENRILDNKELYSSGLDISTTVSKLKDMYER